MSENDSITGMTDPVVVAEWDTLPDRKPAGALVENTDLVVIRYDESSSVLYGRCQNSTESLRIPITVTLHVNGDLCKSVKSVAFLPWAGTLGHRLHGLAQKEEPCSPVVLSTITTT